MSAGTRNIVVQMGTTDALSVDFLFSILDPIDLRQRADMSFPLRRDYESLFWIEILICHTGTVIEPNQHQAICQGDDDPGRDTVGTYTTATLSRGA